MRLALPGGAATLAFLFVVFGAATPTQAQSDDAKRGAPTNPTTIEATGSGSVERMPDHVDVTVGVSRTAPSASEAQSAATKIMAATSTSILALKLPGTELQTGWVDLSPQFETTANGQRTDKIIGYVATVTLRVRTTDLKSPAGIMDAALKAGCNRIDGVRFGIKEALAAREEAITIASKAAKRKAQVMAEAMDLKISRVAKVQASAPLRNWWASNAMVNYSMELNQDGANDSAAIQPGKVEITAEVTVTFVAESAGK